MPNYNKYVELEVWKQSRYLASSIYDLTKSYPKNEQFGLTSQMRRCVISIPSNIAEGCGRQHKKETIHFLSISRGSLYELESQLYISKDLSFITQDQLTHFLIKVENIGKLINGFLRYYHQKA